MLRRGSAARRTNSFQWVEGVVTDIEGQTDNPWVSWLQCEVGYESVRMHGTLLLPPRVEAGDRVLFAGRRRKNRLEAFAGRCHATSPGEWAEHERQQLTRRKVWSLAWLALVASVPLFVDLSVVVAPLLLAAEALYVVYLLRTLWGIDFQVPVPWIAGLALAASWALYGILPESPQTLFPSFTVAYGLSFFLYSRALQIDTAQRADRELALAVERRNGLDAAVDDAGPAFGAGFAKETV